PHAGNCCQLEFAHRSAAVQTHAAPLIRAEHPSCQRLERLWHCCIRANWAGFVKWSRRGEKAPRQLASGGRSCKSCRASLPGAHGSVDSETPARKLLLGVKNAGLPRTSGAFSGQLGTADADLGRRVHSCGGTIVRARALLLGIIVGFLTATDRGAAREAGDPIQLAWSEGDVAGFSRILSPDGK